MSSGGDWWRSGDWFRLLGVVTGLVLAAEGALCIYYLAPLLEDMGGLLQAVVVPFGVQLILIGLLLVLYWALKGHSPFGLDLGNNRLISLLLLLAGAALVLEAIGLAYYTNAHYQSTIIRGFWIAAGAAQLLVLGSSVLLGWLSRNGAVTGWSRTVSVLLSSVVAAEGLFVMGSAAAVEVGEITLGKGTVTLLGLQLFLLGAVMASFWALKDHAILGRKPFSLWIMQDLPLLVAEVVAIEGLILVFFSQPMEISGLGNVREFWSVLFGAQLFLLGTVVAFAWFWWNKRPFRTRPLPVMAMVGGVLLAAGGLFIMGVAAPIRVESVGGMLSRTVLIGGGQLLVIGILLSLFWLLKDRTFFGRDICSNRVISFLPLVLGTLAVVEGIVLVGYASPVHLEGIGHIRPDLMVLAGSQLFFLGSLQVISWYYRDRPRERADLTQVGGPIVSLAIAAEGLFVMGIASDIRLEGFGGISGHWVALAGAQLFALGMGLLGLRVLAKWNMLDRRLMGMPLIELLGFLGAALVAVEGLVIAALSADLFIQGFGGYSGRYILLAGGQLFLLGFLHAAFRTWRVSDIRPRWRRVVVTGLAFLLLLLPPALVL
ncbi:MAG: hypothetical protein ACLFUV_09310 [Methanomassiliicoccales archaeon]